MIKHKLYLVGLFLILFSFGFQMQAQNLSEAPFYYCNNGKIVLDIDYSRITIISENEYAAKATIAVSGTTFDVENSRNFDMRKHGVIDTSFEFTQLPDGAVFLTEIMSPELISHAAYFNAIQSIQTQPQTIKAVPSYLFHGKRMGMSNNFYVKLFREEDAGMLYDFARQYSVQVLGYNAFMPLWFTLSCVAETPFGALEAANMFYESHLFQYAHPEFLYYDILTSTDEYFPLQWNLKNTGQHCNTSDIDIRAEQAWALTIGSEAIKTAIIDMGIEMDHPDLINNMYGTGYNTETNSSPSISYGDHGTECAGIVAAEQNNTIGISGIAPGSKLISISNRLYPTSLQQLANGFSWAWQNGADIISNSWNASVFVDLLKEAIQDALTKGRNGKGCVVIFSSGNDNDNVNYPCNSIPDILAVGAITPEGERKDPNSCDGKTDWGSNYGSELDVVAPGVKIPTTWSPDYDIPFDVPGIRKEYELNFGGTSAAAPHAAGIAALILSVNPNFTQKQVVDIIESTTQKVRPDLYTYQTTSGRSNGTWHEEMGYGLVDAYAAVLAALPCYEGENIVYGIISADTIWNDLVYVSDHIIIPSGVTLTISGTLRFNPYKGIIVQPGGKLIVDGGTLTSACEKQMWSGIEVWGTHDESQYPNYDPSQPSHLIGKQWQGTLELKNGAVIENALCAVALWKPGDYTTTGGILTARDATFRNNAQSIHALHYRNFNPAYPNFESNYQAFVRNCTFEIDEEYPAAKQFSKHVSLASVKGFSFTACDFSADRSVDSVSEWCMGIGSYSSGFSLNGLCLDSFEPNQLSLPCTNYKYNTFEGFRYGIYAFGSGSINNAIFVSFSEFTNNIHGIYFGNIVLANIRTNMFRIGKGYTGCPVESGYGIRIENSSGYNVANNDFTKYGPSPTGDYYGIQIQMTDPPTAEEIYKNSFSNLTYANHVEGSAGGSKASQTLGVHYLCNTNTGNWADFYSPAGSTRSFKPSQGEVTLAAGNTFSPGAAWHFYNGSNILANYYYASGQAPVTTKTYNITTQSAPANTCISDGGGAIDRSIGSDSLAAVYNEALENYTTVNTLYESLKDGGSTAQLQIDIQTAQPTDMWQIRAELLGISPHLSDTVLFEVADKTNVFSQAAIFDILAANPDELKNLDLLAYLEQKENPLPEYMINILHQLAGGITYKTALLQQMAHYGNRKSRAAVEMINRFMNDSIPAKNDSIRKWYARLGGSDSDRRIIASYIEENDFETALTIAESMPETYNFDDLQQIEHERYIDMLELHQTLSEENRYMNQLDADELFMLETYAQADRSTAGSTARGILAHFYGRHYDICPCTDEEVTIKSGVIPPSDLAKARGMQIKAHPNPANTWIVFDYTLPEGASEATLAVTDLQGRSVTTIELKGRQGQHLFDTRKLPEGTYLYAIQANDKQVNGKFVVVR